MAFVTRLTQNDYRAAFEHALPKTYKSRERGEKMDKHGAEMNKSRPADSRVGPWAYDLEGACCEVVVQRWLESIGYIDAEEHEESGIGFFESAPPGSFKTGPPDFRVYNEDGEKVIDLEVKGNLWGQNAWVLREAPHDGRTYVFVRRRDNTNLYAIEGWLMFRRDVMTTAQMYDLCPFDKGDNPTYKVFVEHMEPVESLKAVVTA